MEHFARFRTEHERIAVQIEALYTRPPTIETLFELARLKARRERLLDSPLRFIPLEA